MLIRSHVLRMVALFWLGMFAAIISRAQQPPSISLTLEPPTTLPSIPVAFSVVIDNPGDLPVTIWDVMRLRVTTATSDFFAAGVGGRTQVNLPQESLDPCGTAKCLKIAPHSHRQVFVSYRPELTGNEFFEDGRLTVPGSYLLQLSLYAGSYGSPWTELVSNTAMLTVREPSGADLQVWEMLRTTAAPNAWTTAHWALSGDLVAAQVRSNFPSSTYVPWLASIGRAVPPATAVTNLNAALATNPTGSLRDNLLWSKALTLARLSHESLYSDRNVDDAVRLANEARSAFETLAGVAISDALRAAATGGATKLYTAASASATLSQLAEWDPPAPLPVVPRVECVIRGDGHTFTARFGYSNPNRGIKVLQLGNLNQITPAPLDQGEPRVFEPGDHKNAFSASSPGGQLKWHLDGSQATATADFPVQCQAP